MSLITLSGSPKSGKSDLAYMLALKASEERGKVFIFNEDAKRDITSKLKKFNVVFPKNIHFITLFDIGVLPQMIAEYQPSLVIVDCYLGVAEDEATTYQKLSDIADQTDTQILLVRNIAKTTR
jgi:predicted ATP-dependent serine protease